MHTYLLLNYVGGTSALLGSRRRAEDNGLLGDPQTPTTGENTVQTDQIPGMTRHVNYYRSR